MEREGIKIRQIRRSGEHVLRFIFLRQMTVNIDPTQQRKE